MGDLTAAEESDACITACDGPGAEFEREEDIADPHLRGLPPKPPSLGTASGAVEPVVASGIETPEGGGGGCMSR